MKRRFLQAVMSLALMFGSALGDAKAAGPWRAQIVDAETGKPLGGVIVLAAWYRRYSSPGGWAGGGYYDSEEVVTGQEGKFVIQTKATWTLLPFLSAIRGPEFYIFKPGYGHWRFQGSDRWPKDLYEQQTMVDKAWNQFTGEGAVIELPPLKTREERRKFLPSPPVEVPDARMTKFLEAADQERVFLGLSPTGRSKIGRNQ